MVLIHGSPEIVGGADSTCSVRAGISTSMHCCGVPHEPWGVRQLLASLSAGSLITPSVMAAHWY